ncbi:MAG: undecaprenyl/decaprenyl-phosphate alpha-N-acetylglucosaminyl 1-phosphate transferase [Treponema sp.]|jgi:UDP-GlcNAc:undecaprenyl-phosphate GlcNAc-1-phosphate transferase|nr:undecaprenyl/decaprenyl-phosphate alpha-N-acetylglucosaminyl 1-phosphate transferase [Treponema sp.]
MTSAVITICCVFVLSVLAELAILRICRKKSWYDSINERKIHTGNIPRLGGISFATVFILCTLFINFFLLEPHFSRRFLLPLSGLILVLVSGVLDDFRPMQPRHKLLLQIIAALCVIVPGFSFQQILFEEDPGWLRYPVSFFWIIGLTNAINLIDGVDGLAGGLAFLAALTYAAIFVLNGDNNAVILLCISLTAAIGGFLVFNLPLPKACIFMGDGGSQFLGFILAVLPLIEMRESVSAPQNIPLLPAAAVLSIPIFDTVAAIWRRIRDGRRIDSPDKAHIHHKLMNLGLSSRGVDGVLYGLQILIGALVFFSVKGEGILSRSLLAVSFLVVILFFSLIHFLNQAAAKRTMKLTRQ